MSVPRRQHGWNQLIKQQRLRNRRSQESRTRDHGWGRFTAVAASVITLPTLAIGLAFQLFPGLRPVEDVSAAFDSVNLQQGVRLLEYSSRQSSAGTEFVLPEAEARRAGVVVEAQVSLKGATRERFYLLNVDMLDAETRVATPAEDEDASVRLLASCAGGGVKALAGTVVLSCWLPAPPRGTTYIASVALEQNTQPGRSILGHQVCLRVLGCDDPALVRSVIAVSESDAVVSVGERPTSE